MDSNRTAAHQAITVLVFLMLTGLLAACGKVETNPHGTSPYGPPANESGVKLTVGVPYGGQVAAGGTSTYYFDDTGCTSGGAISFSGLSQNSNYLINVGQGFTCPVSQFFPLCSFTSSCVSNTPLSVTDLSGQPSYFIVTP